MRNNPLQTISIDCILQIPATSTTHLPAEILSKILKLALGGCRELEKFRLVSRWFNTSTLMLGYACLRVTQPRSFENVRYPQHTRDNKSPHLPWNNNYSAVIITLFTTDIAEMALMQLPRFPNLDALSVSKPSILDLHFRESIGAVIKKLEISSGVGEFAVLGEIFASGTFACLQVLFWRREITRSASHRLYQEYQFIDQKLVDPFASVRTLADILMPAKDLRVLSLDLVPDDMSDVSMIISSHLGHSKFFGFQPSSLSKPFDCIVCEETYNNGLHHQNERTATEILARVLPLLEQIQWGDIWTTLNLRRSMQLDPSIVVGKCQSRSPIYISRKGFNLDLQLQQF
ncbi:hypothetical protein BD410DRAFT_810461 [Rickenella mellea]|uniref:Uncharacterized protein n=1 Tax=Rickenella mellea TaxID=50990 RepID=A0A4Y7PDW0_9AGAM|nr:hypothetical protein BD410DRAFT_810461 [Rickenella mellea]